MAGVMVAAGFVAVWTVLGFHSLQEFPDYPFINADYKDMKRVLDLIGGEIARFAGEGVFAKGAVLHWGTCSKDDVLNGFDVFRFHC